jgi:hypothetical protein
LPDAARAGKLVARDADDERKRTRCPMACDASSNNRLARRSLSTITPSVSDASKNRPARGDAPSVAK